MPGGLPSGNLCDEPPRLPGDGEKLGPLVGGGGQEGGADFGSVAVRGSPLPDELAAADNPDGTWQHFVIKTPPNTELRPRE